MHLPLYADNIWLFQKPLDFRCGKNNLVALIQREHKNPMKGIYLFRNKRGDRLKCLCWHKNGFLVLWKELEQGRFSLSSKKERQHVVLTEQEFSWLIGGLPWEQMSRWGEHSFEQFS
jgi:transposase